MMKYTFIKHQETPLKGRGLACNPEDQETTVVTVAEMATTCEEGGNFLLD
jgi:hypothetical protein